MTVAQRSTANRLIADKGQTVTITRRTAGAYDPATGTAAITETTQTGKGVILPLAPYRKFAGNVVAGDETLLLSGLNSAGAALTLPHVDDSVTDAGGNVFSMVSVDPLHPAGLDIVIDCVIRRAA